MGGATRALAFAAALLAPLLAAAPASAQQDAPANGLFLVAKPSIVDPNFSRTVVLVTQAPDFSTVGVILNRPTPLRLSQFFGQDIPTHRYADAIYFGGPVMRQVIVALFRSEAAPKAAAFHVLKNLYLTMHQDNLMQLLADDGAKYRLYAGFSGWAPRQLESEMVRDDWHVLPADEATIFRTNTEGLWEELLARATGPRTELTVR